MKAIIYLALAILLVACVQSLRVEVNEQLMRDFVKRDVQGIEKLKIDKITEKAFNKNIEIKFDTVRFGGSSDRSFEVIFDASTRKGAG